MRCRLPTDLLPKAMLSSGVVEEICKTFHILSDPTRIRILHLLLRDAERSVGEVAEEIGMSVAATSSQLCKMADLGFLGKTARGKFVRYRVVDPCVAELLNRAYCLARDGKKRRR